MLSAALAAAALCGAADAREVRLVMGTLAEVRVAQAPAAPAAIDAAFTALDRVDAEMSLWHESALTQLNRDGGAEVPPALFAVLQRGLQLSSATGGAFDPTVEPLMRADGHLADPAQALSARERAALLARVGTARVQLDAARQRVTLAPGSRVDLGGIAKGWALDRALDAAAAGGAPCAMVDLGGSSLGVRGGELTIDVADPRDRQRAPWATFHLADAALGTSGQAEKPGHVLDPRTGRPATGALGATVVGPSGTDADALSTALLVLGPAGLAAVAAAGADGLVLLDDAAGPRIVTTPDFAARHGLVVRRGVHLVAD